MSRVTRETAVDRSTDLKEVSKNSSMLFDQIATLLNNGILLSDNFDGQILDLTFSGASTNTALSHNLQRVPSGYWILRRSANMVVYDGTSPWTESSMYLASSAAGTIKVFVY